MDILSACFVKAAIHRACQPPADQAGCARLGAVYLFIADDDVPTCVTARAPQAVAHGGGARFEDAKALTSQEY